MAWYWLALILGLLAPWTILGWDIITDFREGGAKKGFETWFCISTFTLPAALIIMGLGHLVFFR